MIFLNFEMYLNKRGILLLFTNTSKAFKIHLKYQL